MDFPFFVAMLFISRYLSNRLGFTIGFDRFHQFFGAFFAQCLIGFLVETAAEPFNRNILNFLEGEFGPVLLCDTDITLSDIGIFRWIHRIHTDCRLQYESFGGPGPIG